jgi:hypothetical protein
MCDVEMAKAVAMRKQVSLYITLDCELHDRKWICVI